MNSFIIQKVFVKNFKSLADFEISGLSPFTCLIGVNGSGKTTFLQLFSFIRALMRGKVKDWLTEQDLSSANELLTIGGEKKFTIEIRVDALLNDTPVYWEGKFNTRELRCVAETLQDTNAKYTFSSGKFNTVMATGEASSVDFSKIKYEGSVFSLYASFSGQQLRDLKLFGVLDPHAIASSTRISSKASVCEVEENGKNLCGFIANLPQEKQQALFQELRVFYPSLKNFEVKKQRFGWKSLLLSELEKTAFSATNLSYGTLRLYLMLSQQYSENDVVLFDEVENGLNQELFKNFVEKLLNYGNPRKQIFVTTHSGLLLNYLPDDVACNSVYFLYRDKNNHTHATRFFEIPSLQDKLKVMGPGEAMGDTDLLALSDQLKDIE